MAVAEATLDSSVQIPSPAGPKGLPLFGNLAEIRKDTLNFFVKLTREYGDVVPYRIGTDQVFLINHPDLIRYVLLINQTNYAKGKFFAKAEPLMGGAMVMSDGEKWLKLRRTALPAVQGRALVGMADVMVDAADDMIARWRGLADTGQPIDIAPEMTILALDMVYRTLFRVKPDFDPVEIYHALSFVLGEIEHRIWSVTSIGAHLPSARNRKFHKYMRYLDRQIAAVIEKRRRDPNQYGDLLSILLAAVDDPENTTYDAKQLRDECMNFTIVGRDTAAGALQWTFYLLSQNPAVERKLRQEIETVLGDRRPTYDDLDRLPYLRMVHDESMRLYPPGWTFSRTALADDRIGGVHIPKGASVQMCVYAMHRNPRYWDNPEGFDPERFLPERAAGRPQFAYFPFGGGGRVCIGRKLAMMEGALIIARILQAFRLNLVPGQRIEIEPMITLRPKYGIQMTIHNAAQPATGAAQPATGAAQPATGAAQPATGAAQPASGAASGANRTDRQDRAGPGPTEAAGCPFAAAD